MTDPDSCCPKVPSCAGDKTLIGPVIEPHGVSILVNGKRYDMSGLVDLGALVPPGGEDFNDLLKGGPAK